MGCLDWTCIGMHCVSVSRIYACYDLREENSQWPERRVMIVEQLRSVCSLIANVSARNYRASKLDIVSSMASKVVRCVQGRSRLPKLDSLD